MLSTSPFDEAPVYRSLGGLGSGLTKPTLIRNCNFEEEPVYRSLGGISVESFQTMGTNLPFENSNRFGHFEHDTNFSDPFMMNGPLTKIPVKVEKKKNLPPTLPAFPYQLSRTSFPVIVTNKLVDKLSSILDSIPGTKFTFNDSKWKFKGSFTCGRWCEQVKFNMRIFRTTENSFVLEIIHRHGCNMVWCEFYKIFSSHCVTSGITISDISGPSILNNEQVMKPIDRHRRVRHQNHVHSRFIESSLNVTEPRVLLQTITNMMTSPESQVKLEAWRTLAQLSGKVSSVKILLSAPSLVKQLFRMAPDNTHETRQTYRYVATTIGNISEHASLNEVADFLVSSTPEIVNIFRGSVVNSHGSCEISSEISKQVFRSLENFRKSDIIRQGIESYINCSLQSLFPSRNH